MLYMLDTSTCVNLIRRHDGPTLQRMQECDNEDICISSVTLSELEYGAVKSADPARNRLALLEFITPLSVAPYEDNAAAAYGIVRADLERAGTPIGPLDTMIAAHALSLRLIVVTGNEKEFRRVADLRVQNWSRPNPFES